MKKYLNKKYLFHLIVILFFVQFSCQKEVLEETPMDFLAPINAYNTIPGIQQGITGLHEHARWAWFTDQADQDFFAIMVAGVGTDIAFHGENPGGNRKLVNYQAEMTSENIQFTFLWTTGYQLIQRANSLIYGINKAPESIWTGNTKKNEYLAEAMFFRAWVYYQMASLYGPLPLINDVISTAKVDFTRTPLDEIYKSLETDLKFAAANLPLPGKEETVGRINQKAAWHVLTQVYLSEKKYQDAVDAASKVIDGYNSALMTSRFGATKDVFGTGDVFLDLFAYGNQNLANNTEAIWVIQFEPIITGGSSYPGERGFGPAYFRLGNTPDGFPAFRGDLLDGKYTGYSDTLGRPVAWTKPTNLAAYDVWRSDWSNDIRNAPHNIKRNFYFDNPASKFNKQKIDFKLYPAGSRDALRDTCQYIFPYFMKHVDPKNHFTDPARAGGGYNHKDVYAIRLAETILLRAEAYLGLNNKTAAAADINRVRTRAKATPVDPSKVDIDYMLDERVRELWGEEFRHITLRRTGKLLERVRKYCNNPVYPACNIQDYNVLWPIPQRQIDLNIGAAFPQNPGYPTK